MFLIFHFYLIMSCEQILEYVRNPSQILQTFIITVNNLLIYQIKNNQLLKINQKLNSLHIKFSNVYLFHISFLK